MFAHFAHAWEIKSEAVAIFFFPYTSWDLRYFRFGGRYFGFLTSAHIAKCCFAIFEFLILENMGIVVGISIVSPLQAELWGISGLAAAILDYWLPLTSHSVFIAIFELLILKKTCIAVGILILHQLQAEICSSSGFSTAIFNLRLPVCQEAHIRSVRWDPWSSKSLNTRMVNFSLILVFYTSLKLYQTCHSFCK